MKTKPNENTADSDRTLDEEDKLKIAKFRSDFERLHLFYTQIEQALRSIEQLLDKSELAFDAWEAMQ